MSGTTPDDDFLSVLPLKTSPIVFDSGQVFKINESVGRKVEELGPFDLCVVPSVKKGIFLKSFVLLKL